MAITATLLTNGNAGSGSSGSTASITPNANQPVAITIFNDNGTSSQNTPTVSGNNLTWTLKKSSQSASQTLLRETTYIGVGASPTTGAIAIDFAGQNQTGGFMWVVTQFGNSETSSAVIIQGQTNDANTTQSGLTVTLNALANPNNMAYGVVGWGGGSSISIGGAFTALVNFNGGLAQVEAGYAINQTAVNWTWTSGNNWSLGQAFEISVPLVSAKVRGSLSLLGVGN